MAKPNSFSVAFEDLDGLEDSDKLKKLVEGLNKGSDSVSGVLNKAVTIADNLAATINTVNVDMPASDWNYVGVTAGAPTFLNSWANYSASWPGLRYRKTPDGQTVFWNGLIAGGTLAANVITTLPAAYVPDTHGLNGVYFPVHSVNGHGSIVADETGAFQVATTAGSAVSFVSVCISYTPKDRTPVVPSCFPLYYKTTINNRTFKPVGVIPIAVVDRADGAQVPPGAVSIVWEYDGKTGVKVKNINGLAYNRKYAVTLLNLAG